MKDYVLGICAAAVICAITMSFGRKGKLEPLLKLICGLVLTYAAVNPVLDILSGDLSLFRIESARDAAWAVEEGKALGAEALRAGIEDRTRAYILDMGEDMGLSLEAEVGLSQDQPPVPQSVTIRGAVAPYERARLSRRLSRDLGIREEDQKWIP